jgi:hypothetical protein
VLDEGKFVCENNQPTEDAPQASTSILSEQTDLHASLGHDEETKTSDIDLNPKQPVTESKLRDRGTFSSQHSNSPMCEKTTSICKKSIYENDSEYRLNSNDEFKIVTNKRGKNSKKEKVNNSKITHTF